jgi:hypothetical protein
MRVSSAYCTIGYFCPKSYRIGRLISPFCQASLISLYIKSAVLTKRIGESGSPYLTPLLQIIFFPGSPLRRTEVEAECSILGIHLIHFGPNPLALSMAIMAL